MSKFVTQAIAVTAVAPSLTWRQDAALAAPELRFPIDGARYCPDVIRLYGQFAGVRLSWDAVTGASFYVVQLCTDQSFKGTTVLGIRTVSAYCDLNYIEHISLSQKIYWRVFAYSANGGTSPSSKVRYLAIECPESSGVDYNLEDTGLPSPSSSKCDQAGVDIDIVGPDQVRKSETERGWVLNVNYDCKAFNNEELQIQDIVWTLKQSQEEPVTKLTPADSASPEDSFLFTASVSASRVESFEIQVEVTFAYGVETFTCSKTKRVLIEGEGNGGSEIVSFTISSASCETGTAEASVTRIACGLASPSVGDSIHLIDDDGCYLLGDNALLIGRKGKAVRMEGDYECGWYIISLCCGSLSSC
jgi:hypothetical protein